MEKKIRDIMISAEEYLAISADASLKEAVTLVEKSFCPDKGKPCTGHSTLLVYDNNMLVGFLGLDDILKAVEPQYLKGKTYRGWSIDTAWAVPVFWEGLFTDRTYEAVDRKVRDIMTGVEFQVNPEDTLIKAVYGMGKHKTFILPVIDESRVVGIVRSMEVFHEICELVSCEDAPVYSLDSIIKTKKTASGSTTAEQK